MRKSFPFLALAPLLLAFLILAPAPGATADIALFDYSFNFDGVVGTSPAGINLSSFDTGTGLGAISFTTNVAGAHSFLAFFDHEIDETDNTFFNESGAVSGTPAPNQSWEIDEPGYVFGDIYDNFLAGTLDKTNAVPASAPDDVSMAMGWNFTLASGNVAVIQLLLSTTAPTGGFYLAQFDPDSPAAIYVSGSLTTQVVPLPGAVILLGGGLLRLAAYSRKRRQS